MDLIKQGYVLISRSSIIVPIKSINKSLSEINQILNNKFTLKYSSKFGMYKTMQLFKMYRNEYVILPKASLMIALESQLVNYDNIIIPYIIKQDSILDENLQESYKKGDELIDVIKFMDKQGFNHKFSKKQLRIMKRINNERKYNINNINSENITDDTIFVDSILKSSEFTGSNISKLVNIKNEVKDIKDKKLRKKEKNSNYEIKHKFICDCYEDHDLDTNLLYDSNKYYPPIPNLYNNQILVCDYLMTYIYGPVISKKQTKTAGCVLIAPTGEGKTHIMMGMFNRIGGKMLIVVPNKVILEQTVEVAKTAFKNDNEEPLPKVTTFYGENKDVSGNIVIAIVNSLVIQDAYFFDQFTFVAIDEAPNYCSESFSKLFWIAQSKCTMAVTATPNDRVDSFDRMLNYHIGPYVFVQEIPGFIASNDNFKFEFNIIPYVGPYEYTNTELMSNGGVFYAKMINKLCKDPYRLSLIINRIQTYYRQDRHIYVFCDRRIYCHIIAKILSKLESGLNMYKNDIIEKEENNYSYIVMGGVSKEKLREAYDVDCKASVVITTYDYLKIGVSIPRMDTMILTSPRRSGLTQIIGRISRRGGDVNKIRIVDDIYDLKTIFRGQLVDRLSAYKLRNGKIKKYDKIKYEMFEGDLVNLCIRFINELSINGLLFDTPENNEEDDHIISKKNVKSRITDIFDKLHENIDTNLIKEESKYEINNILDLSQLNVHLMLKVIEELKIIEISRDSKKFDITKLSPNLKKDVIKYVKLVEDKDGNIIYEKNNKETDILGRELKTLASSKDELKIVENDINNLSQNIYYSNSDIITNITTKLKAAPLKTRTNILLEKKIKDFDFT